jgi:hypothetical protein
MEVTDSPNAPFFLVGSERSGTTLLRLMLARHPRIECAPEFEFIVEFMPAEGGWPEIDAYHEWLALNRVFQLSGLKIDASLDYPSLVKSFLEQYCATTDKPIRGATCHKHFERIGEIWPEARYVHLLRDGRDVARSCIGMGWAGNVWHATDRWVHALDLWAEMKKRLPAERLLEVRYEDLILRPQEVLGEICRFLGTEYDAEMLRYGEESSYPPPDPALVEQWRRKLPKEDLALLEARIGDRLRANGYEESGVPAACVGPGRRVCLAIGNRMGRFQARRRRYGLGLVLSGFLSRALGWKGWHHRVVLARNAIDDQHIR